MRDRVWYWIGIGGFVLVAAAVLVYAAVVISGQADDELDRRDGGDRGA